MSLFSKINGALRFGVPEGEFELLETEKGEPGFFSGRDEDEGKDKRCAEGETFVFDSLGENEKYLRNRLRADINPDMIFRNFRIGGEVDALAVYLNGMADAERISDFVLRESKKPGCLDGAHGSIARFVMENVFAMSESVTEKSMGAVLANVLDGLAVVFLEGADEAIMMDTRSYEHRTVSQPDSEKVVRGPQEAFVESLRTNITLIRRIVRTDDLVVQIRAAGADNGIKLAVVYRDGVANEALVEEVRRRLAKIDTRVVTNNGAIDQLTETRRYSPFPQLLATERPDRVAYMLMQGHVAVLLEGSPYANVMPATLFTLMSTSEDTNLRVVPGSIVRAVRFIGAVLSIILPAYILALALFHQGMLSMEVLTTIAASRKMVSAPIGAEMIFLLLVFQLIREAGLRVPGNIGQALGIIGGLILGQAAVSANLASSVVLIVVAVTGLGNFCIPDYSTQVASSVFRVALVLAAWTAGLLGVATGLVILFAWTASLKSYGVPFLAPYAPRASAKRPMILRGKLAMQKTASDIINTEED